MWRGWAILSVSVSFIDTLASDTKYQCRCRWFSSVNASIGIGVDGSRVSILVSVLVSLVWEQRYSPILVFLFLAFIIEDETTASGWKALFTILLH